MVYLLQANFIKKTKDYYKKIYYIVLIISFKLI